MADLDRIQRVTQTTVVGVYNHIDGIVAAAEKVRSSAFDTWKVYSPVPNHDLEHALHEAPSPVRWFTFFGAAFGVSGGIGLAMYSSWRWMVYLGGKPPLSFQPFVIVGFEMFILFGALATLIGVTINARKIFREKTPGYDPRFSQDCFGLCIQVEEDQVKDAEKFLKDTGAFEVNVEKEEVLREH